PHQGGPRAHPPGHARHPRHGRQGRLPARGATDVRGVQALRPPLPREIPASILQRSRETGLEQTGSAGGWGAQEAGQSFGYSVRLETIPSSRAPCEGFSVFTLSVGGWMGSERAAGSSVRGNEMKELS